MKNIFILLIGVVFFILNSCETKIDVKTDTDDIKSVLNQFNKVFESEDMELLSNIMAHDEDMISFGTDAAERWVGWESYKEAIQKQFDVCDNTKVSVKDQVIKMSQSAEVAWFSYIMDAQIEIQGDQLNLEGLRFTGVLEKRDGKWMIVQIHTSVPVAGQVIEY